MSSAVLLMHTNGSTAPTSQTWLQQSVQQFFGGFNWDDNPPEVQELKLTAVQGGNQPLSMTLKVSQFFSAINWEGNAIAAMPQPEISPQASAQAPKTIDAFTLEDFSDLF